MTRYNDYVEEGEYGDFDEQLHDARVLSYREGVDAVIAWIEHEGLASSVDIRMAILEGAI